MSRKASALAFSYIRFSSERQKRGDSIRRQKNSAEAWAEKNGIPLDTSSYRDLGVSGFTGEHRKNPDRNGLALFLSAVGKQVPKGSYLVVENLDRLTREDTLPAVELFIGLLRAGIRIVQLVPEQVFTAEEMSGPFGTMRLMQAVMELSRGNSESRIKSERIGANWQRVREDAKKGILSPSKTGKVGLPTKTPFWLDKTANGYVLNKKAKAVRRAFELCRAGFGAIAIRKKLQTEFGLKISQPYVRELLPRSTKPSSKRTPKSSIARRKARLALGEWQPNIGGKPVGEVLRIYPAVISEEEFFAAQAAITARDNGGGTRDRRTIYLFNSLMKDEHGEGFTVGKASKGRGRNKFIPNRYLDGKGPCRSFPIAAFETAVCEALQEIDPREILPKKGRDEAEEIMSLTGKRDGLYALVRDTAAAMKPGSEVAVLVAQMSAWQSEAEELEKRIAELKAKVSSPTSEAWGEVQAAALERLKTDDEARARMRAAVLRIVESMTCVFMGTTCWRYAFVQIRFKDSKETRQVVIWHRAGKHTWGGKGISGKTRPDLLKWDTWKEKINATDIPSQLPLIRNYLFDLGKEVERDEYEAKLARRRAAYAEERNA